MITIYSQKDSSRGLVMKNPVMNAAGCFDASDYVSFVDLNSLGAYVSKSITLKAREGNSTPRIIETHGGMLNSIGLQNKGLDLFIKASLPFFKKFDLPVIVSIAGDSVDEYEEMASVLDKTDGVSALEVNISCPHVDGGGVEFGRDPKKAAEVVRGVRAKTTLPLIVKLTPNVTDIAEIARTVEKAGADAVSLINTVSAMAIDLKTQQPFLGSHFGGLSGPAIKPIALGMVWKVSRSVKVPVIGVGGIMETKDALEFLAAGALAIQVGTANFVNPRAMIEIIEGLEEYYKNQQGVKIKEKQEIVR